MLADILKSEILTLANAENIRTSSFVCTLVSSVSLERCRYRPKQELDFAMMGIDWNKTGMENVQTVTAEQQELLLSSTYCHWSQVTIFRAIQYFVVSPLRCSAQINKKTSQVIMRAQIRNTNKSLVYEGANKMTYGYEH